MSDFNVATLYKELRERYIRFLQDKMVGNIPEAGNEAQWRKVRKQLHDTWLNEDPDKGIFPAPLLEGLFNYGLCQTDTGNLIAEKNATHPTAEKPAHWLMRDILPDYRLYRHQLEALTAYNEGRNMIISSGTGSGKTECFLYPMINRILWERTARNGEIPTGVKVLLIYPMNALINDQRNRIVEMLAQGKAATGLRIGVFTSQTSETVGENYRFQQWQQDIVEKWKKKDENLDEADARRRIRSVWCPSRELIRRNPPDILITNYSMLEYMLLRKKDQDIFAGKALQTIVLDEAHFYSGTLGDDLHMLLRRLLLRMGFPLTNNQVRFIATSATIGNEAELANAARALFFGKDDQPADARDIKVIVGEREVTPYTGDETRFSQILRDLREEMSQQGKPPVKLSSDQLRDWEALNGTDRDYLPGKLHTFFKLPEIYYSDLNVTDDSPLGDLSVSPLRGNFNAIPCYYSTGARRTVYFHAQCKFQFIPPPVGLTADLLSPMDENDCPNVYFRLAVPGDKNSLRFNVTRNEDIGSWRVNMTPTGHFVWAMNIAENNFVLAQDCFNDDSWKTPEGKSIAVREQWDAEEDDLPDNNDKRYLFPLGHVSKNMMTTVLVENMMEYLPDSDKNAPDNPLPWNGRQALLFADSRGNAAWNAVSIQSWRQKDYVRNTIYQILEDGPMAVDQIIARMKEDERESPQLALPQRIRRRIVTEKMQEEKYTTFIPALILGELAVPLAGNGRTLEAMQLVSPVYDHLPACPDCFNNRPSVRENWQTHILPEIFTALRRMGKIYHKRIDLVITECVVDRRQQDYWQKMILLRLTQAGAGRVYKAIRQGYDVENRPSSPYACRREEFRGQQSNHSIRRIISRYWGITDAAEIDTVANQLFDVLSGCNLPYLKIDRCGRQHTPCLSIDIAQLYFQRKDGKFIAHNESHEIRLIPQNQEIPANWHDVDACLRASDDWHIFTSNEIGNIVAAEHSAQLDNKDLEEVETNFKANKINLISCTPTMEIGIDIGSLNAVMQANLPPERANYVQRVGRAGRRGQNSALALTILSDSMFDTFISRDPAQIYQRPLTFAKTDLKRDEQEIKRHIHMFFISEYFKETSNPHWANKLGNNPLGAWESVGRFLANQQNIEQYLAILQNEREHIFEEDAAERIDRNIIALNSLLDDAKRNLVSIPSFGNLADRITSDLYENDYNSLIAGTACQGVLSFDEALNETQIILQKLCEQCNLEWSHLISSLQNLLGNGQGNTRDWYVLKSLVMQLEKSFQEGLVEFLGKKRVIPAYGFPLDVVSLYTDSGTVERDLKSAIHEFAPGNTLIKGMDAYTVKGLMPNYFNREDGAFDMLYFAVCPNPACQQINVGPVGPVQCRSCGAQILGNTIHSALKPNGFATHPGRDASSFLSRPSLWTKSEVVLNLEPITFAKGPAETAVQFTSLKMNKDVIYRNSGAHSCGYWLCSCNAMGSEHRYLKPDDDPDQGFTQHAANAPGSNHQITKHNVSIACQGKADVWLGRIPAVVFNDSQLSTQQIHLAGEIIAIALRVMAARQLNTDSRILESHHFFKQDEGLTLCLYEAGASSGYLKAIKRNERDFFKSALDLIAQCNCERGCGNCILNYSSTYKLRQISPDDYHTIKEWIKNHQDQLFAQADPQIAGQSVCSADVFELKDTIRNATTVQLVLPDFDRSMLAEPNNLITQLAKQDNVRMDIFIRDFYPYIHSYIDRQENYLTEQDVLNLYNRTAHRFRFFIVDDDWFDNGIGKNLFLQINNTSSYMIEDAKRNEIVSSLDNDLWNSVCQVINPNFQPELPADRPIDQRTPLKMPHPQATFRFDRNAKFDFINDVLTHLEEDILAEDHPQIKEIEYSDCYIISPVHWAVLLQLLSDLPCSNDCRITIKTLAPNNNEHQIVSIFSQQQMEDLNPRSWSRLKRQVDWNREAAVFQEQDKFIKAIYEKNLGLNNVTISRSQRGRSAQMQQRLEHYRYLKMTFENNRILSLYFDSGVSGFGFDENSIYNKSYFGDNREVLKVCGEHSTLISVVTGE